MMMKKCLAALLPLAASLSIFAQTSPRYGLKPGDKCPDLTFSTLLHFPVASARLSDLVRGKSGMILDFWAVWCSPCVAELDSIGALEKEADGHLLILPVTYSDAAPVEKFLAARYKLKGQYVPTALEEGQEGNLLFSLFPHGTIPHEVWIDSTLTVRAITGRDEVNAANVRAFVSGNPAMLAIKKDPELSIDQRIPIFQGKQYEPSKDQVLFTSDHSILTGTIQELPGGTRRSSNFIECINTTPIHLFNYALNNSLMARLDQTVLEGFKTTTDSAAVGVHAKGHDRSHEMDYTYCYEGYIAPVDTVWSEHARDSALKQRMGMDCNRYFSEKYGITAKIDTRDVTVYSLTRTSATDKLPADSLEKTELELVDKQSGMVLLHGSSYDMELKNYPYRFFWVRLMLSTQGLPHALVDDTGYPQGKHIDIHLQCNFDDLVSLNAALAKYDLQLAEKKVPQEVLVLTKK